MHELRVVRRGRRRLIPVRELERWLEANASFAVDPSVARGGPVKPGGQHEPQDPRHRDPGHDRKCPARHGKRCACSPGYRAEAHGAVDGKRVRRTFRTMIEARAWRAEAQVALRQGTMSAATALTLREAAGAWVTGAQNGSVRNRFGDPYKPSAIRGYEQALRLRVLPELGAARLTDIRRAELQALIDRLLSAGHDPSTIRRSARSFAAP